MAADPRAPLQSLTGTDHRLKSVGEGVCHWACAARSRHPCRASRTPAGGDHLTSRHHAPPAPREAAALAWERRGGASTTSLALCTALPGYTQGPPTRAPAAVRPLCDINMHMHILRGTPPRAPAAVGRSIND